MTWRLRQTSRLVPTPEDWCPSYSRGSISREVVYGEECKHSESPDDRERTDCLVKGTVYLMPPMTTDSFCVRVCFWGLDDTGKERDKHFDTEHEAEAYFASMSRWLTGVAFVDWDQLEKLGFAWA